MSKDTLGDRMKGYELQSRTYLLRRTPVIIRLDGKSFHTFCRGLDKPFDSFFVKVMQNTMLDLCKNVQCCVLGYTQSDEITLVLVDYKEYDTSQWFDGQVQKIVSISAAMCTLYFNKEWQEVFQEYVESNAVEAMGYNTTEDVSNRLIKYIEILKSKENRALFDSRVFNVPGVWEVINNLLWRQQDATRNSINALAQSLFSHKELQGINKRDVQNKMLVEKDVNWNNLSTTLKRGSCCIKDEQGKWFIDNEIPVFSEDPNYIRRLVSFGENNSN